MRSCWIRVGPQSNEKVLMGDRGRMEEAEGGGRWPQPKGRLQPPAAGRGRKDPPFEPLKELGLLTL